MWKDPWFLDLCQEDKLLFIYLFGNDRTTLAGIYEISLRVVCFETGLTEEQVKDGLQRFADANKVYYDEKHKLAWIVNLLRYNAHSLENEKIRINIENSVAELPDCEMKRAWIEHYNTTVNPKYPIETSSGGEDDPSIPYRYPMDTSSHHEHEHEQEQEHDTNAAGAAAAPCHLKGWLKLVRESDNRASSVRYMVDQLYPYLAEDELPDYGRIGATAKRVSGWGRLVQLVWQANQYEPQGDLMSYIEKMVEGKRGSNGKHSQDRRKGQSRRYSADDIPDITADDLREDGYSEREIEWLIHGKGPDPWEGEAPAG
jgi:hypothetical protein